MKIVHVGCVKRKNTSALPARDLCNSSLFKARRKWAEAHGSSWFILSAKHGLLDPGQVIEPYDTALAKTGRACQRAWARDVADSLIGRIGDLRGVDIEIHAGADYFRFLEPLLESVGCRVTLPLKGVVGTGSQIAWYQKQRGPA
jgi:hypothetical protein